jgi:hypothetical protein
VLFRNFFAAVLRELAHTVVALVPPKADFAPFSLVKVPPVNEVVNGILPSIFLVSLMNLNCLSLLLPIQKVIIENKTLTHDERVRTRHLHR